MAPQMPRPAPVSYTHLDVYKRQAQIGKAVLLGVGFQNPFLVRYGIAFALQLVLMGQSRIKGGNEVLGGLS